MRASTSLKSAMFAAVLVAAPFAGAYAGPSALIEQIQGVQQGISDAREANTISAAEAQDLHMRAARLEHIAARGNMPSAQYHELLRKLDDVDQQLRVDTGSGFLIGDGSDGGNYPNG